MPVLHATTHHWTVEEYEKLNAAGLFTESDRVELLDGELILMSPIGYRHHLTLTRLTKFFIRRSRDRFEVSPQGPFLLDQRSEPQPDLCLFDPLFDSQGRHATADQVYLLIEIADSSLQYDREDKRPHYARSGIREYWIFNLQDNLLEVYRDPAGELYRQALLLRGAETIAPLAFPDLELRAGDYFA